VKKYMIAAACGAMLLASGCATALVRSGEELSLFGDSSSFRDISPVYPSTVLDCGAAVMSVSEGPTIFLPLSLIDLPFSIVTDTLFFPSDAWHSVRRRRSRNLESDKNKS
jgi:uncharacterized protein YceK